jgi:hypothetical protein
MRFSILWKKFSGKFKRRAAFGIDAAIMIGFILAMMIALATFGPQILQWFAGELMGGSNGAYALLIELPTWDPSKPPSPPPSGASPAKWVGYAASGMYGLLQKVALGLLSVVLIIAAMCYLLETFKVMNEGTAMNIIMNSAFSLIMIFAIPYIYNGVAAAINAFTGWSDVGGTGLIITGGHEINTLIAAMGGGVLTGGWDIAVRFFGSVLIFIICTSLIMLAVMMGAVRLLIIGCLAAALPLLIMLRLIPPVKHLADSLIETVIGIMFASVIAAILIHFGYMFVAQTSIGGIAKLVIALATFAGAAYMSTMFAGRLGGLFMTMGGMASQASSMATGLLLGGMAMGAGTVAGGVAGVKQAVTSSLAPGAGRFATLKAAFTKSGLSAFATGAGTGLATAAAHVLPSAITGTGPGRVLQYATGAMPSAVHSAQDAINNRAGTVAENLLYKFGAEPSGAESQSLGLEWYNTNIAGKSDGQVGELFAGKMGLPFDPEKGVREIKRTLDSLKANPRLLDRVRRNLESFSALPKEKRFEAIKDANDNWFANRKAMERDLGKPFYDPALETLDKDASYYDKILNHNSVGMAGNVAKARTLALMRKDYNPERLSPARGYDFYQNIVFDKDGKRRSDEDVGRWVRDNLGVHVPDKQLKELGHEYKDLMETSLRHNPRLLDNMRVNLESSQGFAGVSPEADLKALKENTEWVKEHATVESGTDFSDFWQVVGPHGRIPPEKPKEALGDGARFRKFWETAGGQRQVFDYDAERFSSFWEGLQGGEMQPSKPQPPSKPVLKEPPSTITIDSKAIRVKPKREVYDLNNPVEREKVNELFRKSLENVRKKKDESRL